MESLDIILDKVCDELEEYGKKLSKDGKMSAGDLEMVNKLIDVKKNILKTWRLEDEDGGYSGAGDWEARGRFGDRYNETGTSHANRGEHLVREHYSHAGRRRDRMGRYSGDGDGMMRHVEMMLDEAETPREREVIKEFKRQLERT